MSFTVSRDDAPSGYELAEVRVDHREELVRVFFQARNDSNAPTGREWICLRLTFACDQAGYGHEVAHAKKECGLP